MTVNSVAAVSLRGIEKTVNGVHGSIPILKGLDLTLPLGVCHLIAGPSGSGKSTLLHILGLLDSTTAGRLSLFGRDMTDAPEDERARVRGRSIGFIFQNFNLIPRLSAIENVMMPLDYAPRTRRANCASLAASLLSEVSLDHRANEPVNRLSGGEQQRVALARALIRGPKLLLADEPTASLDRVSARNMAALLAAIARHRLVTTVIVSHDTELYAPLVDSSSYISDGRLASSGGSIAL